MRPILILIEKKFSNNQISGQSEIISFIKKILHMKKEMI